MDDIGKLIKSTFKLNGYNLNGETSKYLIELLNPIKKEKREAFIDKIIEELGKRNVESSFVLSKNVIVDVVKEFDYNSKETKDKIFHVIDAYDVPKYNFYEEKRNFSVDNKALSIIGDAKDKIEMFYQRYAIIYQRTIRHELFSQSVIGSSASVNKRKFQLKPIEHLLSHTTHSGEVIVLGMISQLKENKFYLEDPTGSLPLDLSEAKYHSGIYTEGCFVLAEGQFEDGVFSVRALGLPPAEPESLTRQYFGNINFFGGTSDANCKSLSNLKSIEQSMETMFVILSDVWLDSPKVMEKLHTIFSGYCDAPPYGFILFGNFLSEPKYGLRCDEYSECFRKLADLICQFSLIKENSHFIFVPGPLDSGLVKIYPRAGLFDHYTVHLRKKVKNCHFPSNPCRIQFCTRQIMLLREDMLQKMIRNAIKLPDPNTLTEDFTKTIICQASLAPLPLYTVPIYWNYDHIMRLYPLPDLIIVADRLQPYTHTYCECAVINPGSFPTNNYSFKAYVPSTNTIEDCQLPS